MSLNKKSTGTFDSDKNVKGKELEKWIGDGISQVEEALTNTAKTPWPKKKKKAIKKRKQNNSDQKRPEKGSLKGHVARRNFPSTKKE